MHIQTRRECQEDRGYDCAFLEILSTSRSSASVVVNAHVPLTSGISAAFAQPITHVNDTERIM
jgi:hypothetical protein